MLRLLARFMITAFLFTGMLATIRAGGEKNPTDGKTPPPLALAQTISIPQITGGTNHLAADAGRERIFVTVPPDKLLAVVDLKAGKVIKTLTGYGPASALFAPDLDQLCVSGANAVTFYDGKSYEALGKVDLNRGVDELQYDPQTHRLYVGVMDAKEPAIAVIDVPARKLLGEVRLPSKPQGIVLDGAGKRLYANAVLTGQVIVVDCEKRTVAAQWKLTEARSNYPIALDDKNHRLFVGCRRPARLLVLDTDSGKSVASTPAGSDADDMSFDPWARRIYLACGGDVVTVIQQEGADHYQKLADVPSAPRARNSIFVPELKRFCLAVPKQQSGPAELRVYKTSD